MRLLGLGAALGVHAATAASRNGLSVGSLEDTAVSTAALGRLARVRAARRGDVVAAADIVVVITAVGVVVIVARGVERHNARG